MINSDITEALINEFKLDREAARLQTIYVKKSQNPLYLPVLGIRSEKPDIPNLYDEEDPWNSDWQMSIIKHLKHLLRVQIDSHSDIDRTLALYSVAGFWTRYELEAAGINPKEMLTPPLYRARIPKIFPSAEYTNPYFTQPVLAKSIGHLLTPLESIIPENY